MKQRIQEAIREGGASQAKIAEFCGVSEQAVARWKAHGQVARDNLFALSEVTGFRYLYLRDGLGEKRFDVAHDNEIEFVSAESVKVVGCGQANRERCRELECLVDALRRGYYGGRISKAALARMKDLVDVL